MRRRARNGKFRRGILIPTGGATLINHAYATVSVHIPHTVATAALASVVARHDQHMLTDADVPETAFLLGAHREDLHSAWLPMALL